MKKPMRVCTCLGENVTKGELEVRGSGTGEDMGIRASVMELNLGEKMERE